MLTAKTRADLSPRWGVWIIARDMETDAPYPVGYWTGDDAVSVTVDGQARTYYGAGAALSIEPLTYQLGAVVQTQRVSLGALAAEVRQVLRGYNTRQSSVQIHLMMVNARGVPTQVEMAFDGVMDAFDINDGPIDDAGNITVTCDAEMVSDARHLTRTLPLMMSDSSQRLRSATDAFFQYADVAGAILTVWMGEVDNPHRAVEKR